MKLGWQHGEDVGCPEIDVDWKSCRELEGWCRGSCCDVDCVLQGRDQLGMGNELFGVASRQQVSCWEACPRSATVQKLVHGLELSHAVR